MCTGHHDFIPVNGAASMELHFTQAGEIRINKLHYFNSSGWSETSLTECAQLILGLWGTNFAPITASDVQLLEVIATDLQGDTAPRVVVTPDSPITGADTNAAMPGNVTLAAALHTSARGRGSQGRVFTVGMTRPRATGNEVTADYRDSVVAAWTALKTFEGLTLTYGMCVVKYCRGGVWLTEGLYNEVTSITADRLVDSQYRRLGGRGR